MESVGLYPFIDKGVNMTIDKVSNQRTQELEKPPVTVQNELQNEAQKQTTSSTTTGMQKELLQMMQSLPPDKMLQKTAQEQIKQGYLDLKV